MSAENISVDYHLFPKGDVDLVVQAAAAVGGEATWIPLETPEERLAFAGILSGLVEVVKPAIGEDGQPIRELDRCMGMIAMHRQAGREFVALKMPPYSPDDPRLMFRFYDALDQAKAERDRQTQHHSDLPEA